MSLMPVRALAPMLRCRFSVQLCSGAGKTTLMDVLAGRKTQGVVTGELLVNGHPKVQETWARVVGCALLA